MADSEITNLAELTTADAADVLAIVDAGGPTTKKITVANLLTHDHDADYDPIGEAVAQASAAVSTHAGLANPHPDYTTTAELVAYGVTRAPAATQTIVSGAAAAIPLQLKLHASQSAAGFVVQNSAAATIFSVNADGQVNILRTASSAAFIAATYSADANGMIFQLRKSRGALGADGLVAANDVIGQIQFRGSDGTTMVNVAVIRADVDGTPGVGDMPGRMRFYTTPDASGTEVERLRIDSSGNFTIFDTSSGGNLVLGTSTGTKIGTAVTQKLGFFNATPVVQPAAAAQAAAPAGGTGTAAGGWDTAVNRDAAIATINAMRTALVNLGIIKGSA